MKRVTVYIDEGDWKEFRRVCISRDVSASEAIGNWIKGHIGDPKPEIKPMLDLYPDDKTPIGEKLGNGKRVIEERPVERGQSDLAKLIREKRVRSDAEVLADAQAKLDRIKLDQVGLRKQYQLSHPKEFCPGCSNKNIDCTCK